MRAKAILTSLLFAAAASSSLYAQSSGGGSGGGAGGGGAGGGASGSAAGAATGGGAAGAGTNSPASSVPSTTPQSSPSAAPSPTPAPSAVAPNRPGLAGQPTSPTQPANPGQQSMPGVPQPTGPAGSTAQPNNSARAATGTALSGGRAGIPPGVGAASSSREQNGVGPRNTLADCMSFWEPATHMTKTEWRRACIRTRNALDQPTR